MKKLISLLLAVMLVMSVMTFSVSASTDTEVLPTSTTNYEEALAVGSNTVTNTNKNGFRTNTNGAVVVAMEDETDATNTNKIFKVNASAGTQRSTSKTIGLLLGAAGQLADTSVQRYSAKVNLPSVTAGTTEMFMPISSFGAGYKETKTVSVTLKNGGAQYYDAASDNFVNFIANDTMEANHWYLVEVIQDTRINSPTTKARYAYMNVFVYDAENGNSLVGTSGWQYVGEAKVYADSNLGPIGTLIQAYSYPAVDNSTPAYVLVDEFKAYKVTDIATSTYEIKAEIPKNKYVAMEPTTLTNSFRSLGEFFNGGYPVIAADTEDKATRIEVDFRIPTLDTATNVYNLLTFAGSKPYAGSNNDPFKGTAYIDADGFKVRSYAYDRKDKNGNDVYEYNTPVNLLAADSTYTATSYPIEENTWYKLVWDCDFTNYSAPTATLKLLDANGNMLTQTQSYAAGPMPITNSGNLSSSILYCGSNKISGEIHIDNTNAYYAPTVANLDSAETRKVRFEEDFEVYTEEDSAVYAKYEVGNLYESNVTTLHVTNANLSECVHAFLRYDDLSKGEGDATILANTNPVEIEFTYSKPVPVSVLTTNNIEFYADGFKMSTGYTITPGTVENNCTKTFTVITGALDWDTDYVIRVKSEVADYNDKSISCGVPAEPGLYQDIAFSVPAITPDCVIDAMIVDSEGSSYGSTTLTSGDVIKGCVAVTNNDDSQISCYGILAIYDGTKLVAAKKTELITVPADQTVDLDTEAYTATKDGLTAKLFVWNNFELMTPWIEPVYLGQ